MIIAQVGTQFTAGELAAFLAIVAFILGLIIAFRKAFGHNPPLHKAYASKEEHDKLMAKMEDEFKRERSSRKGLYEKIEAQGRDIAGLQRETQNQSRDLGDLKEQMTETQKRIDHVPERTIRLLRETKSLI